MMNCLKKHPITNELSFKRFFRKVLERNSFWTQSVEPGRGGDVGAADLWIQDSSLCIPVELKMATLCDGFLKPSHIRPEQISWARKRLELSLDTYYAFCTEEKILVRKYNDGFWSESSESTRIQAFFE